MDANPVLKPKLATPALVLISVAILTCATYLLCILTASWPPPWALALTAIVAFVAAVIASAVWVARVRRLLSWTEGAKDKWDRFDNVKRSRGTTAEITVLSVDSLEPTGSWITIRWNRFDHIQPAWIEAIRDPIWPGTVLLIAPDPAQVRPGTPWPATYFIEAQDCLAWAPPDEVRSRRGRDPQGRQTKGRQSSVRPSG
jgi:hypothetical protein